MGCESLWSDEEDDDEGDDDNGRFKLKVVDFDGKAAKRESAMWHTRSRNSAPPFNRVRNHIPLNALCVPS